jgi:folate-dependent tRNA-U54 methylase TrmFO/GidA
MNVNFGLFPPLAEETRTQPPKGAIDRKRAIATRALADLAVWMRTGSGGVAV